MVVAKATVEFRVDTPCAGWVEGGGIWDVMGSLDCDASGLQSWLVFFLLTTAYCLSFRIFGILKNDWFLRLQELLLFSGDIYFCGS